VPLKKAVIAVKIIIIMMMMIIIIVRTNAQRWEMKTKRAEKSKARKSEKAREDSENNKERYTS
jgi:uncharacterized membrane protein